MHLFTIIETHKKVALLSTVEHIPSELLKQPDTFYNC